MRVHDHQHHQCALIIGSASHMCDMLFCKCLCRLTMPAARAETAVLGQERTAELEIIWWMMLSTELSL